MNNIHNLKDARISVHVPVPADFPEAVKAFGFHNYAHFFRQCINALCNMHRTKKKIEWPIEMVERK